MLMETPPPLGVGEKVSRCLDEAQIASCCIVYKSQSAGHINLCRKCAKRAVVEQLLG